jgi:hypothetical protein
MAKRKQPAAVTSPPARDADDFVLPMPAEGQVFTGGLGLHDLFAQQARHMLDESDLDEDAKQSILVAMSCPCCGTSGMSYNVKLKRRGK